MRNDRLSDLCNINDKHYAHTYIMNMINHISITVIENIVDVVFIKW